MTPKKEFMEEAIRIAEESASQGDYALGAVVVLNDKIIGRGSTRLKHENDPTVHAEIVAIRDACKNMGLRYLEGAVLYTTHEPCPMCSSAAIWAKMKGIVFGAYQNDSRERNTQNFSWRQIDISCKYVSDKGIPKLDVVEGFMRNECLDLFSLSK